MENKMQLLLTALRQQATSLSLPFDTTEEEVRQTLQQIETEHPRLWAFVAHYEYLESCRLITFTYSAPQGPGEETPFL